MFKKNKLRKEAWSKVVDLLNFLDAFDIKHIWTYENDEENIGPFLDRIGIK